MGLYINNQKIKFILGLEGLSRKVNIAFTPDDLEPPIIDPTPPELMSNHLQSLDGFKLMSLDNYYLTPKEETIYG